MGRKEGTYGGIALGCIVRPLRVSDRTVEAFNVDYKIIRMAFVFVSSSVGKGVRKKGTYTSP
jgi:hypothetical protein